MKTPLLSLLFSIFILASASAQNQRIGNHEVITSWTPAPATSLSNDEVKQVIGDILQAVGAKANFVVQPANIQNAAAVTYKNKRYILYNPQFMSRLTTATGTKWAPISVLAHEIGHLVNPRTASASQQQLELEADEFSGYALRKMGATVEQAQAAMKTLANAPATRTHPAQYDRLVAIENGWSRADAAIAGRSSGSNNTSTAATAPAYGNSTANRRTAATPINADAVLGQVVFNSAPAGKFFITKNLNLVELKENTVNRIGKLTRLNSKRFPYLIYDSSNTQLLVDSRGNILTKNGKAVGVLKAFR